MHHLLFFKDRIMRFLSLCAILLLSTSLPAFAAEDSIRIFVRETFVEMSPSLMRDSEDELRRFPVQSGPYPGRFPNASRRKLGSSEVKNLSCVSLWVMRNEIYARHGRPFQNSSVRQYFQGQSWYHVDDEYALPLDDSARLSQVERANVQMLIGVEKSKNCL